jgi:photosystem II stability/assembly factor-like uncharacterized protein
MIKLSSSFKLIVFCTIILAFSAMIGCSPSNNAQNASVKNPNGRNDTWGFAGVGGGGAMFNPAVSPFNPDYAFVACDMTGAYVTYNGGDSWRMFNLRSPVSYFVFDPSDSNTVYANSIALFKSSDRGATWAVVYPTEAEIAGVVSKGDHAEERVVTKDSTRRSVLAFAVDPDNSKSLHAAISIDRVVGYFSSSDGGKSWNKEKDLKDGAKNVYINPASPKDNRTVYITGNKSITVKENGNWKFNAGPKDVQTLTQFGGGFDKSLNKYIIYAISGQSYFNPADEISGIFYTEDGGANWENRQNGLLEHSQKGSKVPEYRCISTSELNPAVIYVSYNSFVINADSSAIGVAKSADFGKTWELSWKDNIVKDRKGNSPSANFKSGWLNERYGPTWGENPFSIGVSATNPDIVYATDFGRTVKSFDGGKTWEQVYTNKKPGGGWMSRGLQVTTGYGVVFDPFDSKHMFFCTTDIGLMESEDGGESWVSATTKNGVPRSWENSTYWMVFDPEVKGRAWAVMTSVHDLPRPKMWNKKNVADYIGGVVYTENSGKTWTPVSKSMGEGAYTHILLDPTSPKESRTLYASGFGKGVYKSTDGGKSWIQKNNGIEGKEPFAWRIIRKEKSGELLLIVSRRSSDGSIGNELDGALYSSVDGAETWRKLALPAETNGPTSLVVDPENPDHIVLSAWGRDTKYKFSPDIGGGIFISNDGGKSWTTSMDKDQHIHDITYDPNTKTYYACGFNGNAFRSENKGDSWTRIKGYNFKWGKRVDPDPINKDKVYITTFGGGVWHGYAKGDDNAVQDIITTSLAY